MHPRDLSELAKILAPLESADVQDGLTPSDLEQRFRRLPAEIQELLRTITDNTWPLWKPGQTLAEWNASSRSRTQRSAASIKQSEIIPAEPITVSDIPEDAEKLSTSVLSTQGVLNERREEQIAMARQVGDALARQTFGMVEAGTGTGKTLAYLAPAAIWSMGTGHRVIISTYTKALQEQILNDEVPLLKRLLNERALGFGDQLRVAVIKGRSNYLCRTALERNCEELTDRDVDRASFLAKIAVWSAATKTGDRAELSLTKHEEKLFSFVSAGFGRCSLRACKHFANDDCFLPRAKRMAMAAHLVVTNHALLVSNRDSHALVPRGWGLIIDEGHELENAATAALTDEMPEAWLARPLNRISRPGRNRCYGIAAELPEIARCIKAELRQLSAEALELNSRLFEQICAWPIFQARLRHNHKVRVIVGDRLHPDWRAIVEQWLLLRAILESICDRLDRLDFEYLERGLEQLEKAPRLVELTAEVTAVRQRLQDRTESLDRTITGVSDDLVVWLEQPAASSVCLFSAPLHVGKELRTVWKSFRSGVLASGTLTANKQFDFSRDRLCYPPGWERILGSPFDYRQRTRLMLPEAMPDGPTPADTQLIADAIAELTIAADGRSLVLFTSYTAMNQVAATIRPALDDAQLKLRVQGADGAAPVVVQSLRDDPRVVAFGVAALRAGVDIPGDHLSQVIIVKLPFPVFTDPIQEARAEQYRDSFSEYSLPQALIQFRQGFGRLMRKRSDRGVVVVLDGRMQTKPYGKEFIASVLPAPAKPSEWIRLTSVTQSAREVRDFLDAVPITP